MSWLVWVVVAGAMLLAWAAYLTGRAGRSLLEDRALRRALCTKVGHVMTRPVVFAQEDTSVEEAARIMYERNIGCLPVVAFEQGVLSPVVCEDSQRFAFHHGAKAGHLGVLSAP